MSSASASTSSEAPQSCKTWKPACFWDLPGFGLEYAVIVLNQPIEDPDFFLSVCTEAKCIFAADGGANRIRDIHPKLNEEQRKLCKPEAVIGDLDSLRPDVRSYFEDQGVTFVHDPDQSSTDFMKCLKSLSDRERAFRPTLDATVVFGGLGGRADQAFAQIHQLYTASQDTSLACGDLYLFSTEAIMFLLRPGPNLIETPVRPSRLGENVGIIPICRPAIITTEGLEWDVTNWPTEFGTQVSTSNHIRSNLVTVVTNERVLFTLELAKKP